MVRMTNSSLFLNNEEIERVNASIDSTGWIRDRAEEKIEELMNRMTTLDAEMRGLKESSSNTNGSSATLINDLTEQLRQSEDARRNLQSERDELSATNTNVQEKLKAVERLVAHQKIQIQEMDQEIERLSSRCTSIATRNRELEQANHLLVTNSQEEQVHVLQSKFASQNREIERLRENLNTRDEEMITLRHQHSSRVVELEGKVDGLSEKVRTLEVRKTQLEAEAAKWESSFEEESRNMAKLRVNLQDTVNSYDEQLKRHEGLVARLKEEVNDANAHIAKLETDIKVQRTKALEVTASHEKSNKEKDQAFNAKLNDLQKEMQKQLEKLLEDHKREKEEFLKLPREDAENTLRNQGFTLSALYDKYLQEKKAHDERTEEVSELKSQVADILGAIAEKAPEIKTLRKNYDQALEAYDAMYTQYVDLSAKYDETQEAYCDAERRIEKLEREKVSDTTKVSDLSRQVQRLLRVQKGAVSQPNISSPARDTFYSAEEVIQQNLVTFDNVQELQQTNMKQLAVIRELTRKEEELEHTHRSAYEEKLKKELDAIKASREKYQEHMKTLVAQRDQYRVLLAQADIKYVAKQPAEMSQDTSTIPGAEEISIRLELLSDEYQRFRADTDRRDQEKNEELRVLRDQVEKSRLESSKYEAQVKYDTQRLETLQLQLENARAEVLTSRSDQDKTRQMLIDAQSLLAKSRIDEDSARDKSKLQAREVAQCENTIKSLKQEVSELTAVNAELIKQREHYRTAMDNLTQFKNDSDADRIASAQRISAENDRLKAEQVELKKDLRDTQNRLLQVDVRLQEEVGSLQSKYTQALNNAHTNNLELSRSQQEVANLKEQVSMLKDQLVRAEHIASKSTVASNDALASETDAAVSTSTEKMSIEIKKLRKQLEEKIQEAEAHRTIATTTEDQLSKLSQMSENLKKEKDEMISKLKEERDKLAQNLDNASSKAKEDRAHIEKKANDLEIKVRSAEQRAKRAEEDLELLRVKSGDSVRDAEMYKKSAENANSNYERELQLHAAASTQVSELRSKLTKMEHDYEMAVRNADSVRSAMNAMEQQWTEERTSLQKQLANTASQQSDLKTENQKLSEQLSHLSKQIKMLRENAPSSGEDQNDMSHELARMTALYESTARLRKMTEYEKDEVELQRTRVEKQNEILKKQLEEIKSLHEQHLQKTGGNALVPLSEHQRFLASVIENDILRKLNAQLQADIQEKRKLLDEEKMRYTDLEKRLQPTESKESELLSSIRRLEGEKQSLESDLKACKERYENLMKRFSEKIDPADLAKVTGERDTLKVSLEEVKSKLDSQSAKLNTVESEKSGLDEKIKKIRELAIKHRDESKSRLEEIEALKQKVEESNTKQEESESQISQLTKQVNQKETLIERFRQRLKKLGNQKSTTTSEITGDEEETVDTGNTTPSAPAAQNLKRSLNPDAAAFVPGGASEPGTKKSKLEGDNRPRKDFGGKKDISEPHEAATAAPPSENTGKKKAKAQQHAAAESSGNAEKPKQSEPDNDNSVMQDTNDAATVASPHPEQSESTTARKGSTSEPSASAADIDAAAKEAKKKDLQQKIKEYQEKLQAKKSGAATANTTGVSNSTQDAQATETAQSGDAPSTEAKSRESKSETIPAHEQSVTDNAPKTTSIEPTTRPFVQGATSGGVTKTGFGGFGSSSGFGSVSNVGGFGAQSGANSFGSTSSSFGVSGFPPPTFGNSSSSFGAPTTSSGSSTAHASFQFGGPPQVHGFSSKPVSEKSNTAGDIDDEENKNAPEEDNNNDEEDDDNAI